MSAAKRRPHVYSTSRTTADQQETLRQTKLQVEHLKEQLQKKVIDNPQTAKKAALLLSMWIEGKKTQRKKAA